MKINEIMDALAGAGYLANKEIGYAVLQAVETGSPLLVEGDPGTGKTSLAVAVADGLGIPLVRLQCYEGISPESVLYDYDYQRQLLVVSAIRNKLDEEMRGMDLSGAIRHIASNVAFYGPDFLLERPMLRALTMKGRKVLLIDEIDKTTEEIEHALLETLSDFSMTIPEYGTIRCAEEDRPIAVLTSNRYRDLSGALKRRCAYLHIRRKTREEMTAILLAKASEDEAFCAVIAGYLEQVSRLELRHPSSVSEGIAWARFLKDSMDVSGPEEIREAAPYSIGLLAKDAADRRKILARVFGYQGDLS